MDGEICQTQLPNTMIHREIFAVVLRSRKRAQKEIKSSAINVGIYFKYNPMLETPRH